MIFDVSFVSAAGSPQEITRLSVLAEKLRFNAVWMAHDLLWDNAWVICGAVAASTSKILVGPGIVNPFSSSLPEIAMAASSLDNLSNGRCVLGIGPGAKRMLLEGGITQDNVISTLSRSIQYLKGSLKPDSQVLKAKVRRELPIYVGCQSPKLLECIGRWGVGAIPLLTPPSYAATALAHMKKGARSADIKLKKSDLVASLLVSLAKDEQEALRRFAEFVVAVLVHLSPHQLTEAGIQVKEVPDVLRSYSEKGWTSLPSKIFKLGAVGVEECIKVLEDVSKAGFARAKFGSPLGPDIEEALEIFASRVMPHLPA